MYLFFRVILFSLILFHADADKFYKGYEEYDEKEIPVTNLINADGSQIDIPWTRDQDIFTNYEKLPVRKSQSLSPHTWNREIASSTRRDQEIKSADYDEINFTAMRYNSLISDVGILVAIMTIIFAVLGAIFYGSYNLYKRKKDAEVVDYPAYGVTGPSTIDDDPEKNQQSQQMTSPVSSGNHVRDDISDTDEEPDSVSVHPNPAATTSAGAPLLPYNNSYTVFECAGLAAQMSRQEVFVKNPLFPDETVRGHNSTNK